MNKTLGKAGLYTEGHCAEVNMRSRAIVTKQVEILSRSIL